jgi:hypothetical protein
MYKNPKEMTGALTNAYPVDFLRATQVDPRIESFRKGVCDVEELGLLKVDEFRHKTDENIVDVITLHPYIEAMTKFLTENRTMENNGHVNFDPPGEFEGEVVQVSKRGFEVVVRSLALKKLVELNFFVFYAHVKPLTEKDLFVRWYESLPMGCCWLRFEVRISGIAPIRALPAFRHGIKNGFHS